MKKVPFKVLVSLSERRKVGLTTVLGPAYTHFFLDQFMWEHGPWPKVALNAMGLMDGSVQGNGQDLSVLHPQ